MRNFFFLCFLVITLASCFDKDIFEPKCGEDVKLGGFELSDTTQAYLPYQGDETLVFEDSLGRTYRLTSAKGLEEVDIHLDVHLLCEGGLLETQYEYYDGEWNHISFQDSTGDNAFDFEIMISSQDQNDYIRDATFDLDSIAIYERFTLSANKLGMGTLSFDIITNESQGQLPDYVKYENQLNYRILSDTTINGKLLKDVILAKRNGSEMYILYNKEKGLVAFKPEHYGYWVLMD
ncbi:MAG: hypothetical protein GC192_05490 [Bacteroidetes bacterium]|nr:hypothetical protein [Bacteroidota bacterium]